MCKSRLWLATSAKRLTSFDILSADSPSFYDLPRGGGQLLDPAAKPQGTELALSRTITGNVGVATSAEMGAALRRPPKELAGYRKACRTASPLQASVHDPAGVDAELAACLWLL